MRFVIGKKSLYGCHAKIRPFLFAPIRATDRATLLPRYLLKYPHPSIRTLQPKEKGMPFS